MIRRLEEHSSTEHVEVHAHDYNVQHAQKVSRRFLASSPIRKKREPLFYPLKSSDADIDLNLYFYDDEKIENNRKWISTKIIISKRDLSNGILGFLFMQRN